MISFSKSYPYYSENNENCIDEKTYKKIVDEFSIFMRDMILDGNEIYLPEKLGSFCIIGKKIRLKFDENGNVKNLAINWKDTIKLWNSNPEAKAKNKTVHFMNENTNGVRYRLLWSKKNVFIENKVFYSFVPCRTFKRMISSRIQNGFEYKLKSFKNEYNK